jgi:peptide/nickel transport system substrate-binding protein
MNTSRGIFRDVRLRRAVNYALDRVALAAQPGPLNGQPADTYLPSSMPGSSAAHLYPLRRPNLAKAKALARGHGGSAVLYTCHLPVCRTRAEIVRRSLAPIGIAVTVKTDFPIGGAVGAASVRGAPFDLLPIGWLSDYSDPGQSLLALFDGNRIRANANSDLSYLDERLVNARLERADQLRGRARERAFGAIAADLARDQALFVA